MLSNEREAWAQLFSSQSEISIVEESSSSHERVISYILLKYTVLTLFCNADLLISAIVLEVQIHLSMWK